jgi:hypothetical protein
MVSPVERMLKLHKDMPKTRAAQKEMLMAEIDQARPKRPVE